MPRRPVIPWFRVKEFKVVTLKMIVSSMLLHQSKIGRELIEDSAGSHTTRVGGGAGSNGLPSAIPCGVEVVCEPVAAAPAEDDEGEDEEQVEGAATAATATCEPSGSGDVDLESTHDLESLSTIPPAPPRTISGSSGLLRTTTAESSASPGTGASCGTVNLATAGRRAGLHALVAKQALQVLGADLYVSGEVTQQQLGFPTKTTLIVSAENPGAGRLAQEILTKYPELRSEPSGRYLGGQTSRGLGPGLGLLIGLGAGLSPRSPRLPRSPRSRAAPPSPGSSQLSCLDRRKRVFLLYLNQETWLGAAGSELADQVRAARAAGISVVLVHECDPTLGGCEFAHLFQTTPQDLVADELYAARIAVAFHTGQHRDVSLCLLAREIGAVRRRLKKLFKSRGSTVVGATTSNYLGCPSPVEAGHSAPEDEHLARASSYLTSPFEVPADYEGGRFDAREAERSEPCLLALEQLVSTGSGWPASEEGKPRAARYAARKWLANAERAAASKPVVPSLDDVVVLESMGATDGERMAAPVRRGCGSGLAAADLDEEQPVTSISLGASGRLSTFRVDSLGMRV